MIEVNGKKICENCFEEITSAVCPHCKFDPEEHAADPAMLAPGTVLLGKYIVGGVIGKGGFGITYLAYDTAFDKKVAVKEYFPYGIALRGSDSTTVSALSEENTKTFEMGAEKFYNEAKIVSKFNGNPNIVGVYDAFYENETAYFVMEYLRGRTLKEYIRDHGTLPAPQALHIAQNVAGALVVVHSANVLHRDISPDNIILCENGDIKIIDFGAARQVIAEHSQNFSVILKPGFAPLEQYRKKSDQGAWTDVYSLGTTLYYMLTGDIPEDPMTRYEDDDTFKENRFDIDPELWDVISKAVKLNVEERYQDAYELKKALNAVQITPEPIISPTEYSDGQSGEQVTNFIKVNPSTGRPGSMSLKPKKSFFRRHLRTIVEVVCCAAFVAVIIPLAVKAYKPIDIPDSNNSSSGGLTSDDGNTSSVIPGREFETFAEIGFDKPFFSEMDDDEKRLYEILYYLRDQKG